MILERGTSCVEPFSELIIIGCDLAEYPQNSKCGPTGQDQIFRLFNCRRNPRSSSGFVCASPVAVGGTPSLPDAVLTCRIGSRVGRGPDWKWGSQGNNCDGTIISRVEDGNSYLTISTITFRQCKSRSRFPKLLQNFVLVHQFFFFFFLLVETNLRRRQSIAFTTDWPGNDADFCKNFANTCEFLQVGLMFDGTIDMSIHTDLELRENTTLKLSLMIPHGYVDISL